MISQCVTLIDQGRQVVATAQVAEQDGSFIGQINLRSMPVPLQRLFKEYEEIVRPSTAYRNYRASLARGKRLFLRAISFW